MTSLCAMNGLPQSGLAMPNRDSLVIDAGFCLCTEMPCKARRGESPRRIHAVGDAGSGKSTLAGVIGSVTGSEILHLDEIQFGPDWQSTSSSEVQHLVAEFQASHDSWVVEGNLPPESESLMQQADLVVWLDVSFVLSTVRLARRVWGDFITSRSICNGNRASFWREAHPWNGCLAKKLRKRRRKRREFKKLIHQVPHVVLRNDSEIYAWLYETYPAVRESPAKTYRELFKEVNHHDERRTD